MDKEQAIRTLKAQEAELHALGVERLSPFGSLRRRAGASRSAGLGNVLRHACDTVDAKPIWDT